MPGGCDSPRTDAVTAVRPTPPGRRAAQHPATRRRADEGRTMTRTRLTLLANSLATVLDGWTPTHQNTMVSQVRNYKFAQDSHFDTWWVENGSFVRGQNFTLGYTLPEGLVQKMKLSRIRVSASVQNLFLSTKYTGYDPEVDTFNSAYGSNSSFSQNLDFFAYPRPRT